MKIRAEEIRSFHVFMETNGQHVSVEIAFSKPGGGMMIAELPAPFGCVVSMFFLGCLETAKRIERVPTALRGMVSHTEAIKMMIEAAWPSKDESGSTEPHLH